MAGDLLPSPDFLVLDGSGTIIESGGELAGEAAAAIATAIPAVLKDADGLLASSTTSRAPEQVESVSVTFSDHSLVITRDSASGRIFVVRRAAAATE